MGRSSVSEVFLIECSGQKLSGESRASELYTSDRFVKARALAEKKSDNWYILSAKHGLVEPNQIVQPYDLDIRSLKPPQITEWAERASLSIMQCCQPNDRITFLCSENYSDPLVESGAMDQFVIRLPFKNMTREKQLKRLVELTSGSDRIDDLNRFYTLLGRCKTILGSNFGTPNFAIDIPEKGVYFFLRNSESRFLHHDQPRIVRVGTHGVSRGSKSSLLDRLNTHYGTKLGGGNHRSSIMRLHIGAAMLEANVFAHDVPTWGSKTSPKNELLDFENQLEKAVSNYISQLDMICLAINDESSASSDRAYIEQNSIALLAGRDGPVDVADSSWLGSSSPKEAIQFSSLWNVDCIFGKYDPDFLDILEHYVKVTVGDIPPPRSSIAPQYWYDRSRGRESKGQKRLF